MTAIILSVVLVAGLFLNALRLRARIPSALPAGTIDAGTVDGGAADDGKPLFLLARGVEPDGATRRAAAGFACAQDLDLLELVPADLPATAARDLLRAVDPRAYRNDRLAPGRSAGAALLASPRVAERAETGSADGLDPADVIAAARAIRPCARARATMFTVAPRLRAGRDHLDRRAARLRANGAIVPFWQLLDTAVWLLTIAAVAVSLPGDWEWGLAAAVAYSLQPYLIFAGTPLRPGGLYRAALARLLWTPYILTATARGRWRSAAELEREEQKARGVRYYREELAAGTARFLQTRAADCPWCGSGDLSVAVRSRDLVMGKPGTFTLDRCGGCGHVFQNPRLSPEGLDFYYRDAYDGLGAASAETVFATGRESYEGRAHMVQHLAPGSWLDVGAGHAHFCAVASEILTGTVFDGLDQGAGIKEAERRGWIGTAYRGEFRDLTAQLAGRYDVVSMHHYLEHTADPRAELDAAAAVLPPGGHLLIELPDPEWRLRGVFGQYWMPWFQPQHLSMVPLRNLVAALTEAGLRPVATERGAAHQASDFVTAGVLLLARMAPDRGQPWSRSPDSGAWRAWRSAVWTLGVPLIVGGLLLDRTIGRGLARRWDRGNAYRVLAVKDDDAGTAGPEALT
ncbi:MAG TPA: class I SAM-dependent methyltransferase [Trebonia sp.]